LPKIAFNLNRADYKMRLIVFVVNPRIFINFGSLTVYK